MDNRSIPMVQNQNLALELKLSFSKLLELTLITPFMLELLIYLVTHFQRSCWYVSTQFKFPECVLYCYVEIRRVLG